MSRLLPDKFRLLLAPATVGSQQLQRSFLQVSHRPGITSVHACSPVMGQPNWQAAVDTAAILMAGFSRHAHIDIVLANQFVRYLVLPAMPAFTPMKERMDIASLCFQEAYGEAADGWAIRVNPLPHGDSLLCCAIDRSLLAQLQVLATRNGLSLNSLQPAFMCGFNAVRRQIKAGPACFVQLEEGRANIALIRNGAWQSLAVGVFGHDWQRDLIDTISRELLLAGLSFEDAAALIVYVDTSLIASGHQYEDGLLEAGQASAYGWQWKPVAGGYKTAASPIYHGRTGGVASMPVADTDTAAIKTGIL